ARVHPVEPRRDGPAGVRAPPEGPLRVRLHDRGASGGGDAGSARRAVDSTPMPFPPETTSREPSGFRVLALTTLQQAGLTCIRFGLPILAPFWRDALRLSLGQVGLLLGAFDLG